MHTRLHQIVTAAHEGLKQAPMHYNQSRTTNLDPDGFGPDCSGQVTKWIGGPKPGYSTVTLVTLHIVVQLPSWNDAQPGDLWGLMGWNTGGAGGHVGVIVGTPATDGAWVIIDHGFAGGPRKRRFSAPPSNYKPYRVRGVEMGTNMKLGDRILAIGATGDDVGEWQRLLISKGISVGATGADEDFGNNTRAGTIAFQNSAGLPADGVVNGQTLHRAWGATVSADSKAKLVDATNRMTEALTVVKSVVTTL